MSVQHLFLFFPESLGSPYNSIGAEPTPCSADKTSWSVKLLVTPSSPVRLRSGTLAKGNYLSAGLKAGRVQTWSSQEPPHTLTILENENKAEKLGAEIWQRERWSPYHMD